MAAVAIGVNVVADIIASLIKKAAHQARYLFCFNNIVETLGKEKQQLIKTQQSIEDRAKRAHGRTETIGDEVQKWLKDAENLITEVDKLQEETTIHSAGCGWCPNCIQRYRLGRRMTKKTEELTQVKGNCNFSAFARLATLRGMEYYSSEGFISFESRKRAYDQIIKALKDDGIRRIGVHGMGGSGKTTLVKEVGKEVEKLRIFEKVLIVVVSNHPDITKIQDGIAGSLGIEFKSEKTEPERARRLSMALSNRGKILVILDDVWERLDFEVIGIPNNSDILLTTRESSVCSTMECQKVIPLSVLDDEESWILFRKHAGITDDNFDTFKDVGQDIANECKGLPVAIAAVASSLKGKEVVEWEEARDTLRDSRPMNIEPGLRDPYKCLQLSYDNIRSEEVKSLFLLCSFFPEDYEIPVEFLTRFAIGLGLFGKVNINKRARSQVSVAKNKLIDSCLLLKGSEENCIKMHDLVRDVALWIARTENKMIIGEERSKKELQEHSILKESPIRYLWCKVDEFLDQLYCPKLECLVINIDLENGVEVPNESFNGIKELRVLVLYNGGRENPILQMSKPIQSLTNLRYLLLVGCQLGDISFVCSLTTIESLMLLNCSFHELPDGVANLKYLRLLDLSECKIEKNPCGVIERSSQLEELYFVGNTWEEEDENNLEFFGKNSDTSVLKLQRYRIEIGESFKELDDLDYSITRYLSVQYFDTCSSYATIDDLMRRAESLCLGGIHGGCKSIIPDLVQKIGGGVNELTELIVYDSDEVECVVGITNSFYQIGTIFSNLTHLEISGMKSLQNFFLGRPHHGLFEKLEELHISNCDQLRHIIANEVEEIVSDGDNPRSPLFPKLKKLLIAHCEQLEYLMPVSYARGLLQLEKLEIRDASQMKYVFGQSNHEAEDLSCNQNENEFHIVKLQALKSLELNYLPSIISICPENCYPSWPALDSLELIYCAQLNIMHASLEFRQQDHTITKNGIVFCNLTKLEFWGLNHLETLFLGPPHHGGFGKLEELRIGDCDQLKHIIANEAEEIISDGDNPRSYNPLFPKLKELFIENCEQLEYLMPVSFARGLLQLEELEIRKASQLKYVFGQSNHEDEDLFCNQNLNENEFHIVKLQALKSLELIELPNIISICPENCYPSWPSLDSLKLIYCPPLKNILAGLEFRQQDHTSTKNVIVFCNLTKLEFWGLNHLETLFLGPPHHGGFGKLEELRISNCDQLKHIIANEAEEIISDGDNPRSYNPLFPKLKELFIENCKQLEYLMPVSFARGLLQLEELKIRKASQLKYVFGQSNHEAEDLFCNQNLNENEFHIVKLQALKSLELIELPNIISICPENCYPSWPSLDSLKLKYCPPLKNILAGLEFRQQDHTSTKNVIVFCNLTKLEFWGLNHLETLFLGPPHHGGFGKLEELRISNCDQLKHIIANEAEEIISDGDNPRSYNPLFPKLKELFIENCKQLEYLMPVSFARGLLQLEELKIRKASQLKYVFGQSNHEAEDLFCNQNLNENEFHIVKLQALKSLELIELPNIISICPENCYPSWPSLDSLKLKYCPPLKNILAGLEFRQQDHTITKELGAAIVSCVQNLKLLSVWKNSEIDSLFDLQGLPMDGQQVTAGLIDLSLKYLPELKYIWKGHKHFLCLQNLQKLQIHECGKLKVIFSTSILRSLNQLKMLDITNCEELQQIIEEDDENKNLSNPHSGQVCLPQLTTLYVEKCNKLKCLFPSTTSIELPKLTSVIIKEASELEEVIACEKGDTKEQVQVKFPKLEHLILVKLPNLREVYKGSELETVRNRVVHDCPKLSLMSSTALENLVQIYENYEADDELNLWSWRIKHILEELLESGKEIQDENCISRTASSNDSEITARPSPSLMDEQPLSETSLMDRQEAVGEIEIHFQTSEETNVSSDCVKNRIKETVEASDQEGPKSDKIGIAPLSTDLEPKNPSPGPLVLLQNPSPQSIKGSVEEVPILDDAKIITSTYLKGTSPVPGLSQVNTNQSMQGNEAQNDQNDNCIKSEEFLKLEQKVSTIASPNLTKSIKEAAKEFDGGFLDVKIPTIETSNDSELATRTSPSTLAIPLHTTPSPELVDEQSMSGTSLIKQPEELGENAINSKTPQETIVPFDYSTIKETVEASDQEGPKSEEIVIASLSTDLEPRNLSSGPLVLLQNPSPQSIKGSVEEGPTLDYAKILTSTHSKATSSVPGLLQGQISVSQTKTYVGEDVEEEPINPEEFKDVDLVGLLQSMEEDSDTHAPMPSFSIIAAKNPTTEDNLVAKSLADLEVSLKIPLEDIASSEAGSLRLENALNFLSCHSFDDDAMLDGLKAAIDSLHQDFPSILSSFKQASATIDQFTVLEEKEKSIKEELPQRKESAVTLTTKISKTEMSMAEIQQKETILMEKISRLQVELNNTERRKEECEAELSSLQEQKKKCVAETIEFKKEFESVKKDKSQMTDDHRKARQELFKLAYKWSALCSQFEQNHSAARSLS